jgi:hypothetical protein
MSVSTAVGLVSEVSLLRRFEGVGSGVGLPSHAVHAAPGPSCASDTRSPVSGEAAWDGRIETGWKFIYERALKMSFWDIVWFILISFAFVAYLLVMFAIVTDLFRDPKASGFEKAVWIVALIFLPFLTSLIYVVVKGKGMAERQVRSAEQMREQQDAYIKQVAGSATPAEQIAQAKAMLDSGTITPDEYERLKEKALA